MSRPQITHDNTRVMDFLEPFYCAADLCIAHPRMDDILSGLLSAKTEGDTSRRTLSRHALFHILSRCPVIDTASVLRASRMPMADRTARAYAATARTASQFIARFLDSQPAEDTEGVTATSIGIHRGREESYWLCHWSMTNKEQPSRRFPAGASLQQPPLTQPL